MTYRPFLLALACLAAVARSQTINSIMFGHNAPVTQALPNNLKLAPALKNALKLELPTDFERTVLKDKYKFKDPEHLLKALLHESYERKLSKEMRDSYQPFDQIGTMVVDYMFTRHLLLNMPRVDPRQLSIMKNVMVHRDTIAFTALKNGFLKFIKMDPATLEAANLKKFIEAVDKHTLYQDIVAEIPDAGKRPSPGTFVHRMFKGLIGAVYVDSGFSMETVDKVFLPLFKTEMDRVLSKVVIRKQNVL